MHRHDHNNYRRLVHICVYYTISQAKSYIPTAIAIEQHWKGEEKN